MTEDEKNFAADLARIAPDLAGTTEAELRVLIARYGTTDETLRALVEGTPTRGARAAAVGREEEAKAEAHYAKLRASSSEPDAVLRARYPTMHKAR